MKIWFFNWISLILLFIYLGSSILNIMYTFKNNYKRFQLNFFQKPRKFTDSIKGHRDLIILVLFL